MGHSIGIEDLDALALGATFLGAGGGGDLYLTRLAASSIFGDSRRVEILPVESLQENMHIVCIAGYGAPTIQKEKLLTLDSIENAYQTLKCALDREADAFIAAEMGGGNALMPLLLGAKTGIPVIDGDGMGRAFPELQMTSYAIMGLSPTPCTLVDEHLNSATIRTGIGKKAERLARAIAIEMGLDTSLACYPMSGAAAKRSTVRGTLSKAKLIGECLATAINKQDAVQWFLHAVRDAIQDIHICELFRGKVADVERSTQQGFAIGSCRLMSFGDDTEVGELAFQNEYITFESNAVIRALVPDLICVVDVETAAPITTPDLRYGQRVAVIGVSCDDLLRSNAALKVVGPNAFGIDKPYTPIEELHKHRM